MLEVSLDAFGKHYEDLDRGEWARMPQYAALWLLKREEQVKMAKAMAFSF